ncbi:MAG TPA: DUF4118 domain-containing protein [Parachlamydiaceae bacterium]|nr:DUF4118 domain-containing protein [Parachlamydiaceae bacterium]
MKNNESKDDENRPNPEELLQAVSRQEKHQKKGKLKIFLGMAAGVGKTYAMLREARALTKNGIHVVIGTIDTHGRKETMALLEGLKAIPEKTVIYKDHIFKELNLEEILKQKPFLVLVDELAHSNIPGLRHEKRWQDVQEILANGINVYTTLNVQHIESLKDIVEEITGISIKETVPDSIIDEADSIQLVDLNPDELLKRLHEGKVYFEEQSKIASLHFFKSNKLTALREILLRYTAEKINYDLHQMIPANTEESKWKPREKLLVAISPSPHSQKLIRSTRRLAFNLEAPWIAVYVDTGRLLDESEKVMLSKNLSLARDLGAEVITTSDPNIVEALQRTARRRHVTQIVVGRSPQTKFFNFLRPQSLLDRLAKECTDIDIHVIRQEALLTNHHHKLRAFSSKFHYLPYFFVLLSVLLLAVICFLTLPMVGYQVIGEFFFIGILALSLFFKKGPIFFAAFLFSFIWYFFFIPPESKFSGETFLLLGIYILTAGATGILVDRYRTHQDMLAKREETSNALYHIIKQLSKAESAQIIFKEVTNRLQTLFGSSFEIIIKKLHNGIDLNHSPLITNEKEKAAALWAYENGKEAGFGTDTLPFTDNLYIPIKNPIETAGLLVCQKKSGALPTLEEKNFLHTVAQQICHLAERQFAEEKAKQDELRVQIEKIHASIFKRLAAEMEPSLREAKDAMFKLKKQLASVKDKALTKKFSGIMNALEEFSRSFENISKIDDLK